MTRNVLSGEEVRQLSDGFAIENASWTGTILERARQELERRKKAVILKAVPGGEDLIPAAVFEELGAEVPSHPEPIDPRQAALDEAAAILTSTREEAAAIASNIRDDAKARASLMVEKAQAESREILERARAEAAADIEKLKNSAAEEGRKSGLEQGRGEGLEKGRAEGRAEFETIVKEWAGVLRLTLEERKRALNEVRPLVVELVGESLYRCLKDEGLRNSEMVVRFVAEALQKANDRVQLRVHLNPMHLGTVEAHRDALQVSVGSGRIELVPDLRIEKGGCLLETEAGSIDARLSTVAGQAMDALSPGA